MLLTGGKPLRSGVVFGAAVATKLIPVVQEASGASDMNIVVNSGAAAGQNVMHYHIHLLPRKNGDGFDVPLPFPGSEMPNRQRLDAMAARIGSLLRDPLSADGQKSGPKRK